MRLRFLAALLIAAAAILSLPGQAPARGQGAAAKTPALRRELLVSGEWLAAHLNDSNLVILCVARSARFCEEGRIPGARWSNLSQLVVERGNTLHALPPADDLATAFREAGVNNDSRIVLYGEGLGLLAARAFFTLDYLGHGNHAALLDGGLETWKRTVRPLSTEAPVTKKGTLTAAIRPEVSVEFAGMEKLSRAAGGDGSSAAVLLDARPEAEFSGEKLSQDVPRAGHIPGAACLHWMALVESRENPVLKPESELRRIFAASGARADSRVVTYCRTGMQASMDYFVARYLGYEAGLYSGSFLEWGRSDAPVRKDK